ncbi:hypothetical protein V6N11_048028 [Hibiscus sabdariffa]|uniref:Disease resistance protein At4g27190-like leucine-rich repeats domain-containing protein n=1 Tax=Hibiscus sabdariffa TaxID=183260 RepID=A0ABR2NXX3_9ROSI
MEEMQIGKVHAKVSPSTPRFHTLREVEILGCDKLTDVTWLILAPNLRSLSLECCAKIEEILSEGKLGKVADVVGKAYPTPFLKLENLFLCKLPELKSIYWDALPFPCLTSISIDDCLKLKKLPLNSDSIKGNHFTIWGSQDWWAELEWENEVTRRTFFALFSELC